MDPLRSPSRLSAVRATSLGAAADPALDRFASVVARVLHVPIALVTVLDDREQYLPGQHGLPEVFPRQMPVEESYCQHVVLTGQPLVLEQTDASPLVRDLPVTLGLPVRAYAGVPLLDASGEVLGSLCAISGAPRAWSEDDIALLTDLAAACASELALRAAVQQGQTAQARLALLAEVTRAVVSTLDPVDALGRLTRLVVPALGDWCTASLLDGDPPRVSSKARDSDLTETVAVLAVEQALRAAGTPTAEVVRTGEPVLLDGEGVLALTGRPSAALQRLAPASVLVVPLRARTGSLGHLTLGRGPDRPGFGEAELHDAVDIGRRTGLALDNAALFTQQRSHAEALQRASLTQLPEPDHLALAARYEPAAESAQIGGDWYDAFLQPDGATVLVVGDVMGHDMAAAAMMGQVRSLVRGIVYDRDEAPATLLSRVDRSLVGLQVDTLATVVLARMEQTEDDLRRGVRRLRWSNAGHPPPVLLSADGAVRLLETPGELLLGIDPTGPRTEASIELAPGDTVLLYTDGLVERRDSPLEHGLTRLRQALSGLADTPLEELCDELLERMLPRRAEDDVVLLAVRTGPALPPGRS